MGSHNYTITYVLTPPNSSNLVSLYDIKMELDLTDSSTDNWLNRVRAQVSAAIAQYCNRSFGWAAYKDVIRSERPNRFNAAVRGQRDPLRASAWPITAVESVVETIQQSNTTLVSGTDYEVRLDTGEFFRLNSYGEPRDWPDCTVTLTYEAGWVLPDDVEDADEVTLPPDIQDAALRLIRARYHSRGRDPYLRTDNVAGVRSVEYWQGTGPEANLPPDVEDILDNYRTIIFA